MTLSPRVLKASTLYYKIKKKPLTTYHVIIIHGIITITGRLRGDKSTILLLANRVNSTSRMSMATITEFTS